ncbi:MAG: universal stress protein [Saonia sp.]
MKRILIPTDFSKNAWNAISFAMEFFKDQDCTFYFLHTYTPAFYRMDYMMGGPSYSAIPDAGVALSLAGLERTLEDIKKQFPNKKHSYETLSAFNLLIDEIKEVCTEKNIDMIVMGTKGATGAKEIFMGTQTVYTIRKVNTPVLAIPDDYSYRPVRHILFPSDYMSRYKQMELDILIALAKTYAAKIIVLHATEEDPISEKQNKNKAFLARSLKEVPHTFEEIEKQYMPNVVYQFIQHQDIELLVMMNRKHSFLERLLIKQNVDAIGFEINIPFLVIRDTSEIAV